ncbi:MAG: trehalase family glycosidase [Aggregatilineales bacterium]
MTDWATWVERCAAVLRGNQISSRGHRYTRPAPHVYEHQWLWDSCFHAITYRWFDVAMAREELLSLVASQALDGPDAGMIPHMVYWQGDGTALWGQAGRSIITQPPLIAVAALRVHTTAPDQNFLLQVYPALCAYHNWFDRRRDPDGDNLVTLIHPWESGWDASPRWDAPMNLSQPTDEASKAARHALVQVLRAHDCDVRVLTAAGSFSVEPVDFNAIRAADLEALAQIATLVGDDDGGRWAARARAVQQALQRCKRAGRYYDLSGAEETPLKVSSAAPFVLLFGGALKVDEAAQLVAELTSPAYWPPYPVPTTPTDSPAFDPDHYWRGNLWPSVNWLIYHGLRRYGFAAVASQLAERFQAVVDQQGFYEYFNPVSGQGHGPALQSWTTILLDIIATEREL